MAFIARLCAFGLTPRATIEISSSKRRLDKIISLIHSCGYSFHDLSRVELDRVSPVTPRFNMPFELGLAIGLADDRRGASSLFIFEAHANRLKKSLSDLDGTDPLIHDGKPDGVLRALSDALSRFHNQPQLVDLRKTYDDLCKFARGLKSQRGGSLYGSRAFKDLVFAATTLATKRIAPKKARA